MQILHRGIFMPAFDRILQLARMEEMDCEFVEVTAYEGARPTHAVGQGLPPRGALWCIRVPHRPSGWYCGTAALFDSSAAHGAPKQKHPPGYGGCFYFGGADGSRTRVRKESG